VIIISDDEDDYDDEDILGSESSLSPTPSESPSGRRESPLPLPALARQRTPPGQPSPAVLVNPPNDPAWQNYHNLEDEDLNRFEGFDDLDVRDAELERIIMEEYNNILRPQLLAPAIPIRNGEPPGQNQENVTPQPEFESKVTCVDNVVAVFPGICRDHVSDLYETLHPASDRLIAHILDKIERGESYPTAKEIQRSLKRKRNVDEDEQAVRKYGAVDRVMPAHLGNIRTLM
jgi:TRIAD3 protein (E3 ubiquitin-protein ligase RNF216)